MIHLKLFVLLLITIVINECFSRYCEICPDHTLCQYNIPGPSSECEGYDESAVLNEDDVTDIVNRINARRNLIALGYSRNFPQAANMRKITWSHELATFAQRWADQCDPNTRPDERDQCRDLEDTPVGQNIATITGPAPGLTVKSFVDIWFMQSLDYTANVVYYNESHNGKTNFFTQLIWAETDFVGCGKAKFFIEFKLTHRLVCNFAPRGNVHGKPIYALGYAATQCPRNMSADEKFTGLCSPIHQFLMDDRSNLPSTPPVRSLLRILNLSNKTSKQDIDPIKNNLRQTKLEGNETNNPRNQKYRHVFINNTYAGIPHEHPAQPMYWNDPINLSHGQNTRFHNQERGHSRVYHGHQYKDHFDSQYERTAIPDFRKTYEITTTVMSAFSNKDLRKHNQYHLQCTRKSCPVKEEPYLRPSSNCDAVRCTRKQSNNCFQSTSPCPHSVQSKNHPLPYDLCECKTTCAPTLSHCNYINRQCIYACPCHCPQMDDDEIKDDRRKSAYLYNLSPNVAIRSGDEINFNSRNQAEQQRSLPFLTNAGDKTTSEIRLERKQLNQRYPKVTSEITFPKYVDQEGDYSYGSFDSSERQRRQTEDKQSFKPFLKMDEYSNIGPSHLKSLRYTTLANWNKRKNRKTKQNFITESITIPSNDINRHNNYGDHGTEKYLSFEELMHLRKFGAVNDGRRQNKPAARANSTPKLPAKATKGDPTTNPTTKATPKFKATKKPKTTIQEAPDPEEIATYTTVTPFQRKKYCTRKLTCTWTAATVIGADGSVIGGGGGGGGGSKTPPGYVDGCTRTSTCTRDYLIRNKFPSTTEISGDQVGSTEEDEDYCEKRDLNVPRYPINDVYTTVEDYNQNGQISLITVHSHGNFAHEGEPLAESENCKDEIS